MILNFARIVSATALILASGSVSAQDTSTNRVVTDTDWSVFVDEDPKECWGVSAPKETRIGHGSGGVYGWLPIRDWLNRHAEYRRHHI